MWIRQRFNANRKKHYETLRNYVGEESIKNNADLRQRVLKIDSDKEHVEMMCKQEIEALMRMAADVTNMTHKCKLQGEQTRCKTPTQMRKCLCKN